MPKPICLCIRQLVWSGQRAFGKQVNTAPLLLLHALLPANTSEARPPADEALNPWFPIAMPLPTLSSVSADAEEDAWGDEAGRCCDHSDHFVTTVCGGNPGVRTAGPVGDFSGNTGASRPGISVNSALRQRLLSSQQASVSIEAGQGVTGPYSLQAYCLGE